MRFLIFFLLFSTSVLSHETKLPYDYFKTQAIYHLNNGKIIFIEQYGRRDRIWEKNTATNTFKNISHVWNFIAFAERCEGIKEENIYFAHNLEYWLGGGTNIDDPQIRIFRLNDSSPWRDSDLSIVPNMDWAKQFCTFYKKSNAVIGSVSAGKLP